MAIVASPVAVWVSFPAATENTFAETTTKLRPGLITSARQTKVSPVAGARKLTLYSAVGGWAVSGLVVTAAMAVALSIRYRARNGSLSPLQPPS